MSSDGKAQNRIWLALGGDLIYCSVERMLLCSDSWCTEWHAGTAWLTHNNTQRGLHFGLSWRECAEEASEKSRLCYVYLFRPGLCTTCSNIEPPGTLQKSEISMCLTGADFSFTSPLSSSRCFSPLTSQTREPVNMNRQNECILQAARWLTSLCLKFLSTEIFLLPKCWYLEYLGTTSESYYFSLRGL